MGYALFEYGPAMIRRYSHEEWDVDIEIHQFLKDDYQPREFDSPFQRPGINHICIHTGGPNSRMEFLSSLPLYVKSHIYDNPKGWQNIFIRDFEGNWIELRENL